MRIVTLMSQTNLKFAPEKMRVLIVDDQDNMRKAMKRLVTSLGIVDIVEAYDGDEAIEECNKSPFDLVLCDLYMRKVDGLKVLDYMRSQPLANDTPFILITGEGSREDIVKAADKGANGYLLKPFQTKEFEDKVISILNTFHSPSELLFKIRNAEKHIFVRNYSDAIETLKEAINIDPQSVRAKYTLGLSLYKENKINEAAGIFKECISLSPTFYRSYAMLANIYLQQNKTDEAIIALKKELELHPKQPNRQTKVANLLIKSGLNEAAIDHLREALKDDSKYKPALLSMGIAFAEIDDLEKSIYYFKRIRRHYHDETKALNLAVKYCLDKNQTKKAEMFLRDELGRYKDRLDTRMALAKLYLKLERNEEAIELIKFVLQKDDKNIEALKTIGSIQLKNKNYQKAEKIYRKLYTIVPSDLGCLINLAEILLQLKKYQTCETVLMKAIRVNANNGRVLNIYGMLLLATGQFNKANLLLTKAKSFDPESERITQMIKESKILISNKRRSIGSQNTVKAVAS